VRVVSSICAHCGWQRQPPGDPGTAEERPPMRREWRELSSLAWPAALAALLRPIFPSLRTMIVMERPGQYVSHEWIGQDNYLHEKIGQNGKRTRGALFTSADAAVMFECVD